MSIILSSDPARSVRTLLAAVAAAVLALAWSGGAMARNACFALARAPFIPRLTAAARHLFGLAAVALCLVAAPVAAQTIGDATYDADFPLATGSQSVIGQSVSPPANSLDSYTLYLQRGTATLSVVPFVYEWTSDPQAYPVAPLWTGAPVPVTSASIAPVVFTTGGVVLDPTKIYVLAVRLADPAEDGAYGQNQAGAYAPGSRVYGNTTTLYGGGVSVRDLPFSATFSSVAPAPVPTLSEWAMILMGLMLAGCAAVLIRQRRILA